MRQYVTTTTNNNNDNDSNNDNTVKEMCGRERNSIKFQVSFKISVKQFFFYHESCLLSIQWLKCCIYEEHVTS